MANRFLGWITNIFSPGQSEETAGSEKTNSAASKASSNGKNAPTTVKGMSVHIGLNSVDPNHYKKADGTGWDGKLNACERDALDMTKIAKEHGFQTETILTAKATRKKIRTTLSNAAQKLKAGDIFLITYSGHGGQVPDYSGDEAEIVKGDDTDETWCLFDGQMLDDELNLLYANFDKDVRILVFSDSCHSGTVTRNVQDEIEAEADPTLGAPRMMRDEDAIQTFFANEEFYKSVGESMPKSIDIAAPILLISGCQDEQLSRDGMINGRFTGNLKKVLAEGGFNNYREFHQKILDKMPDDQKPNYFPLGDVSTFEKQRPFQI